MLNDHVNRFHLEAINISFIFFEFDVEHPTSTYRSSFKVRFCLWNAVSVLVVGDVLIQDVKNRNEPSNPRQHMAKY